MKKILFIHHGQGLGGGLSALVGLVKKLSLQYDVEVYCIYESSAVDFLRKNNIKVKVEEGFFYRKMYRLLIHSEAEYSSFTYTLKKVKNIFTYFINKYYFAPKVLKKITTNHDLICLNSLFISDWIYGINKVGKKSIQFVREPLKRGNGYGLSYTISKSIENNVNQIIAISRDNANRLMLRQQVEVIYDPVNITETSDDLSGEGKYFLYLGGMQRIKGIEQLSRSLKYLDRDVKILFLGPLLFAENKNASCFSKYSTYNEGEVFDKILSSSHVKIIGMVEDISAYLNHCTALISPFSKPHASLPILEALSIGKIVIASDVDGTEELIDDSVNGFIFKNGEYKQLATLINKVNKMTSEELKLMEDSALKKSKCILHSQRSEIEIIEEILNDGY